MSVSPAPTAIAPFNPELTNEDIHLTAAAARKIAELCQETAGEMAGIRIFVAGGGCSGMKYGMTFTEEQMPQDCFLDGENYKIFIDAVAVEYMRGVEIDFVERPLGEASFVFNNVFAQTGGSGTCGGCGSAGGCGS